MIGTAESKWFAVKGKVGVAPLPVGPRGSVGGGI